MEKSAIRYWLCQCLQVEEETEEPCNNWGSRRAWSKRLPESEGLELSEVSNEGSDLLFSAPFAVMHPGCQSSSKSTHLFQVFVSHSPSVIRT